MRLISVSRAAMSKRSSSSAETSGDRHLHLLHSCPGTVLLVTRITNPPGEQDATMHEPAESPRMSPTSSLGHLCPPHYAGIEAVELQAREPHGDEEVDPELMPDEVLELAFSPSSSLLFVGALVGVLGAVDEPPIDSVTQGVIGCACSPGTSALLHWHPSPT